MSRFSTLVDFQPVLDHFVQIYALFQMFLVDMSGISDTIIEPNFVLKNCIWLNIFCLDFKMRARQQRHHYFEPTCMPLNHFQPDPEF